MTSPLLLWLLHFAANFSLELFIYQLNFSFISCAPGVLLPCSLMYTAAIPATKGVAMEVPLRTLVAVVDPIHVDSISSPVDHSFDLILCTWGEYSHASAVVALGGSYVNLHCQNCAIK